MKACVSTQPAAAPEVVDFNTETDGSRTPPSPLVMSQKEQPPPPRSVTTPPARCWLRPQRLPSQTHGRSNKAFKQAIANSGLNVLKSNSHKLTSFDAAPPRPGARQQGAATATWREFHADPKM